MEPPLGRGHPKPLVRKIGEGSQWAQATDWGITDVLHRSKEDFDDDGGDGDGGDGGDASWP